MARKKVDGKLLKIKRNLKDSPKCNVVDLVCILTCTDQKRTSSELGQFEHRLDIRWYSELIFYFVRCDNGNVVLL